MIRLGIAVFFMVIFIIVSLPFLLLCYITKLFGRKVFRATALFFIKIWARLLLFLSGAKLTVIGKDKVNKVRDEAVLFVGNHRGLLDIPTFYGHTPKPAGFVAKKEIDKIPVVNLWMRCAGCLFLDRSAARKGAKTIIKGISMIKEGDSLFIFPEGTRSKTEEMGSFKAGSLKLSEKSGCPVIPVAIIGTDKVFEANGKKFKRGKCKLIFGEPVRYDTLSEEEKKNYSEIIKNKIQELIDEHKESVR